MKGIEKIKEFFKGYEENYVIIGGTACSLLMEEYGSDFRTTKDIDMVLIIEYLDESFSKRLWKFINLGEYQSIYKDEKDKKFYRFEKPKNLEFPHMIELFTRKPTEYDLIPNSHLLPIHIADDISSLSAILLDDEYYEFLKEGIKIVSGISVLDEFHLIPFKAKVWCELTERSKNGEEGQTRHIKKHKNDIAKLITILPKNQKVVLKGRVLEDMKCFIDEMSKEKEINPNIKELTVPLFCELLTKIYLEKEVSNV